MGNAVQRAYDDSESSSEHELIDNAAPAPVDQNDEDQPSSIFGAVSLYFGSGTGLSSNESFGFPDDPLAVAAQSSVSEFSSPLAKTPTIKSAVNLIKGSLKLIPNPDEPKKFGIQFIVDVATDCTVTLKADGDRTYSQPLTEGSGQLISTPNTFLDSEAFSAEAGIDGGVFSIDIQLSSEDLLFAIRSQSTHCLVLRVGEELYEIKAVKQKVMHSDVPYIVYDIFGLESGTALSEDCVICLSEVKDTVSKGIPKPADTQLCGLPPLVSEPGNLILIPCRHLCICSPCAQVLKFQSNKCPICRASVRSMLSVNIKSAPAIDTLRVELDSESESTERLTPLPIN